MPHWAYESQRFSIRLVDLTVDFYESGSSFTVWDRVPKEDAANFESDTFL